MPCVLTAIAGGVGAARFLRGLVRVVPAESVTAIVNTGDDIVLHGLNISPDLDTVTYTLADAIDAERGWGLAGETWAAMTELARYGGETWFRLGDRDLGTHLYRTQRLRDGATLTTVTAEISASWGLGLRLLPVTDDVIETRVTVADEGEIGFQEYFVGRAHDVAITGVRVAGAEAARPAPGVLEAIRDADTIVICPSNPIVSIGPVLTVPGVEEAIGERREDVVAVSPIVGGQALKGPAARMMDELGHERSVVGIARLYAPFAATLVMDDVDAQLAERVAAEGVRPVVTNTVMHDAATAAALARVVLTAKTS